MSVSWGAKDPDEVKNYSFSWLGRLAGDTIASATLTVDSGTVVLSNVANTTDGISATVSGGRDCETATIISRIVTAGGETLEQSIVLKVDASPYVNMGPSTNTKRQLIEMAYEECSLAGYEFNLTPEELFSGLRQLDALMAEWRVMSKDLNYNAPAIMGQGDLEDYSGVPDAAVQGVSVSLAMRIAPKMGKAMSAESRASYGRSMDAIKAMCAVIPQVGWPRGTPAGAGNRRWGTWGPFLSYGSRCR